MFYAVIGGGLASQLILEELLPDVTSTGFDQKLFGIVWAFVSGFLFEKAIDTVRSSLQG